MIRPSYCSSGVPSHATSLQGMWSSRGRQPGCVPLPHGVHSLSEIALSLEHALSPFWGLHGASSLQLLTLSMTSERAQDMILSTLERWGRCGLSVCTGGGKGFKTASDTAAVGDWHGEVPVDSD